MKLSGFNVVKFPFARGEETYLLFALLHICSLYTGEKRRNGKTRRFCTIIFLERMRN